MLQAWALDGFGKACLLGGKCSLLGDVIPFQVANVLQF